MYKKRWLVLISSVLLAGMVLSACGGATEAPPAVDEEAQARIAELEAALEDAKAMGGATDEQIAELQAELEDLNANIGDLESSLSETRTDLCSYNAYRMGWVMDWADAGNIVNDVFGADSTFQYTFWQLSNPGSADEFRSLVYDAYRNTDMETRAAQWQEAEKMVVEDIVAVIPIQHYDRTTLVSTDVNALFPPFGSPKMSQFSFKSGKTTMVWPLGTAIPTLDIQAATDTTSHYVLAQLIDHPYQFKADGTIEPSAATSYEVSDDGTVYTVHLREDALWSDGEPVVAQHFVDGIKRLLSPDLGNDYAYVMFGVAGAAEFASGDVDTLDSVRAVDDYTMEITLTDPLSYFDSIMAFFTLDPVRLDVIALHGDAWTQPGNFVSNGAYVLVEHNPGENLVLEKNPLYWDADNVSIERIEIPIITEPATSLAAFEAGETDTTGGGSYPAEDVPRLVDTPEFTLLPRPGTYYLGLNTVAQHTSNVNFRKALASAIDKRTIIDNVEETPWRIDAWGVTPPEIFGYQGQNVGYGFDLDAALGFLGDYMAEAGIENAGDIVVELWYNKGGTNQDILEAVEAMWEENLGITVNTVNVEWASYLDTLDECNAVGGGGF